MIIVDDWMMSRFVHLVLENILDFCSKLFKLSELSDRLEGEIILDPLTAGITGVSLLTRLNPIMNDTGDTVCGAASTTIHKATTLAGLGDTDIV